MNIRCRAVTMLSGIILAGGIASGVGHAQSQLQVVWLAWPEEYVVPLMEAFKEAHPKITLNYERIPFNEIFQTLEVRLAARTPDPAVYIVDGPLTASYAARGHLLDLSPHLDQSPFTQAAIDQALYDGKMYSAPFGSSSQILFYNKDLFEAAGVEPPSSEPQERWTWEQVANVAERLSNPEANVWGLVIEQSARPYQLLPLPQSLGGKALSDDGLTATGYVDSPEFVEAFQFYQNLYQDRKASPPGIFDSSLAREVFGTGRAAMFLGGTWNFNIWSADFPELEWGVAPHPYFEDGKAVTPTGSWHFGINPRTDNMDGALTFLEFMMSDEIQSQWFSLSGYPPVLKSTWEDQKDQFNTEGWRIVQYELDNTAVPRPATAGFREYEDILRTALRDIQQGAEVGPTLSSAAEQIDRELQKYR